MKKFNVIFLDIDGILNSQRFYESRRTLDEKEYYDEIKGNLFEKFDPVSSYWINKLIDDTESKIVISSVWRLRGLDVIKELWQQRNMSGEIIGITPKFHLDISDKNRMLYSPSTPRGLEIDQYKSRYFKHNDFSYPDSDYAKSELENSLIKNYLIIDDDCDMLWCQRNNFILVKNELGFLEDDYIKGIQILS